MQANQAATIAFTWSSEGPYSDDPDDSGNWSTGIQGQGTLIGSQRGVTAPELIKWLAPAPVTVDTMKNLSDSIAEAIFTVNYWNAVDGDFLPTGVDLSLVDMGYNAGVGTSGRLFQQILQMPAAACDGWVGDETMTAYRQGLWQTAALTRLSSNSVFQLQKTLGITPVDGKIGPVTRAGVLKSAYGLAVLACVALRDSQVAHYIDLQNPKYQNGWINRADARLTAALALFAKES